jgi:16S rRNA (guanine966-N2)-methyltransferase
MRIISGLFKGKKLLIPEDIKTRPLKDLTKESIFNIILHSKKFNLDFSNANILDLFAGVGSFGIECLSRGARYVVFAENYNGVLPILKKNLNNLEFVQNFQILEKNIYEENFFLNLSEKYDLIFLDPPYKDKDLNKILLNIKNSKILNREGIIITHRHKDETDIIPSDIKIIEEKKYGISKINFLSM